MMKNLSSGLSGCDTDLPRLRQGMVGAQVRHKRARRGFETAYLGCWDGRWTTPLKPIFGPSDGKLSDLT